MDDQYWQNYGLTCPKCDCEYDFTTQVVVESCYKGILTLDCYCPACHENWTIVLETKIAKGV